MAERTKVYYKFCESHSDFGDFYELHMSRDRERTMLLSGLVMMIPLKHRDLPNIKEKWLGIIRQLNNDKNELVEVK